MTLDLFKNYQTLYTLSDFRAIIKVYIFKQGLLTCVQKEFNVF